MAAAKIVLTGSPATGLGYEASAPGVKLSAAPVCCWSKWCAAWNAEAALIAAGVKGACEVVGAGVFKLGAFPVLT